MVLHRHGQFRQSKHRTREDVDDNLLVDATLNAAAEDEVAAHQPREECVPGRFFAGGRREAEEEHDGFVDSGEGGEVARVLACGFEDQADFLVQADLRSPPLTLSPFAPFPSPLETVNCPISSSRLLAVSLARRWKRGEEKEEGKGGVGG